MATNSFTVTGNETATQTVENGSGIVTDDAVLNPTNTHAIIARGNADIQIDGTVNAYDNDRHSVTDSMAIKLEDAVLNLNIGQNGHLETSGSYANQLIRGTIIGDSTITNAGSMISGHSGPSITDTAGNSDLTVSNAGSMEFSNFRYVSDTGRMQFDNSGTASGVKMGSSRANTDGPALSIHNDGEMGGVSFLAKEGSGATMELNNSGVIKGRISTTEHVHNYSYDELPENGNVIVNSGTIEGAVLLSALSDTYDGREGVTLQQVEGDYGNDTLLGGAGNERFFGEQGDDTLEGNGGNDLLDGGEGNDTVLYSGNADDYIFTLNQDGTTTVNNTADAGIDTGTDTLASIEQVKFSDADTSVAIDTLYGTTPPVDPTEIADVAGETQYLVGSEEEIFVINGNSADYGWGPTEDGTGIVVWSDDTHDILWDFKAIRFNDQEVSILAAPPANEVADIAGETQYLTGDDGKDRFVIAGEAAEFGWGQTDDGTGIVVWNNNTSAHDILWDYEEIAFNDETVTINEVA